MFWKAPLSNISRTSWSINQSCSFDIFFRFGMFSCNGKLTNEILFPFSVNKSSWSWVIFPQAGLKYSNIPDNSTFGMLFVNYLHVIGCRRSRVFTLNNGIRSELLVKELSFWVIEERTIWCWTVIVKLSGARACVAVMIYEIFTVFVSITWFCSVRIASSTVRFSLIR